MISNNAKPGQNNHCPAGTYIHLDPKYIYDIYSKKGGSGYESNGAYAVSNYSDGKINLDTLLEQKQAIISSKVQMLYTEIDFRNIMKDTNLYQINIDQCTCRNLIYNMDENIFDKKRIELERKILDLEEEKRREQVNFFRDISFLNKELRYSLIEKLEEDQKSTLISNQVEELTCKV